MKQKERIRVNNIERKKRGEEKRREERNGEDDSGRQRTEKE